MTKFSIPKFGVTVSLLDIVAIRDPQNTATAAWFSILFSRSLQFQVFDVLRPKDYTELQWRKMVKELRDSHNLLYTAWVATEPKSLEKGNHALPFLQKPDSQRNSGSN